MADVSFTQHDVSRLFSVAHLFPKGKRCGIYVLCFAGGQRYVGQAVDVVRRFGNHRRRWQDIETLLFAACKPTDLNELELRTIRSQRSEGYLLRNISHAQGPIGESDLDPLVTQDEQFAWLNSDEMLADSGERSDDPEQREKFAANFKRLSAMPEFAIVAPILTTYVASTVPKPRETERTFWALSALPSTGRTAANWRLAAVSINKMETFVLLGFASDDGLPCVGGFINVSESSLLSSSGASLATLRREFPKLTFTKGGYESAGGDCLTIGFLQEGVFAALLIPGIQRAARHLNLMLMRKGPTFQWRRHCYDLADVALAPVMSGMNGWSIPADADAELGSTSSSPRLAKPQSQGGTIAERIERMLRSAEPGEWFTQREIADAIGAKPASVRHVMLGMRRTEEALERSRAPRDVRSPWSGDGLFEVYRWSSSDRA